MADQIPKRGRGRPRSNDAKTGAERQSLYTKRRGGDITRAQKRRARQVVDSTKGDRTVVVRRPRHDADARLCFAGRAKCGCTISKTLQPKRAMRPGGIAG